MVRPILPEGAPVARYEPLSDADKAAVLKALESCPTVSAAVRAAFGDDRRAPAIYAVIRNDPIGFGAQVERAKESYRNAIRNEIFRRGVTGIERPLAFQGVPTGYHVREYSDEMLKVAARLALPEYLDKKQASDVHIHGEIAVAEPGTWSISDAEALALPDELKAKLADVLRYLAKHRRELAREQRQFEARADQAGVQDAEFTEVASAEHPPKAYADPFDVRDLDVICS